MHILTLHRMLVQKDDGSGEYVQKKGDRIRPRPNLTATLKAIIQNGFSEIYNGTTATNLRSDIRTVCAGGPGFCRELQDIISSQELEEYEAKTRTPFKFSYDTSSGYDVYTAPAPYGGPALAVFLGIVTSKYMYMQSILTYLMQCNFWVQRRPIKVKLPGHGHLPLSCSENNTYAMYNAYPLLWVV